MFSFRRLVSSRSNNQQQYYFACQKRFTSSSSSIAQLRQNINNKTNFDETKFSFHHDHEDDDAPIKDQQEEEDSTMTSFSSLQRSFAKPNSNISSQLHRHHEIVQEDDVDGVDGDGDDDMTIFQLQEENFLRHMMDHEQLSRKVLDSISNERKLKFSGIDDGSGNNNLNNNNGNEDHHIDDD